MTAADPAHIGGIIFYKETLLQSSHTGQSFVEVLNSKGVLPGIKVDEASWDGATACGSCRMQMMRCSHSHACQPKL